MQSLVRKYIRRLLAIVAALGALASFILTNIETISVIWFAFVAIGCAVAWDEFGQISSPVAVHFAKGTVLTVLVVASIIWYWSGGLHWTVQYVACSLGVACKSAVHYRIAHDLKSLRFSGFRLVQEAGLSGIADNIDAEGYVKHCKQWGDDTSVLSYQIENPSPGETNGNVNFKVQSLDEDWILQDHIRSLTSDTKGGRPIDPREPFEIEAIEFDGCAAVAKYYICISRMESTNTSFAESVVELADVSAKIQTLGRGVKCQ